MFRKILKRAISRLRLLSPLGGYCVSIGRSRFWVKPNHYQLRGIIWQGIPEEFQSIMSLCDEQTLYLDIGGNIGIDGILIGVEKKSFIVFFEPSNATLRDLMNNVMLNDINFLIVNSALSSDSGIGYFTNVPASGINRLSSHKGESIQIISKVTLDQWFGLYSSHLKFERIVIKIDVERHEIEVLAGASSTLNLKIPMAICIEVSPDNVDYVRSTLARYGFVEGKGSRPEYKEGLSFQNDIFLFNHYWRENVGEIECP